MDRRDFVKSCVLVATGAAIGAGGVVLGQALLPPKGESGASPMRFGDGREATVADLDASSSGFLTLTWRNLPASVIKVPIKALEAAAASRGVNTGQYAQQHPTSPGHAIVAFEGKCTHLGCTVGFNTTLADAQDIEDYDSDGKPDGRIMCPCHQSQFDHHDLGMNLPGMPAQKPLPVLRFRLADGVLVGYERIGQEKAREADRDGAGAPFRLATQA